MFTTPNPAWYYLEIAIPGEIVLEIQQTTGPGGTGTGLDVDYAIWGPFPNLSTACNDFTQGDCTGDHICSGNVLDCSYSPDPIETATIPNALVGDIYMVLITNYDGSAGFITMSQTNSAVPGAGSTDCSIVCPTMVGTNPTGCSVNNGLITVSGLLATTSYTISYLHSSIAYSVTVTSSASGQAIISGLEPGSYTNILTNFPDCTNPSTVTLAQMTPPVLNSINSNAPVCSGATANFILSGTANATVTYNINGGTNQTILLNNAGTGTVTINAIAANTTLNATSISTAGAGCITPLALSHTIAVTQGATLILLSNVATTNQFICGSVGIDLIKYTYGNVTGVLVTGLPPGLSGGNVAGIYTIAGIPTASGVFIYTVNTLGGCTATSLSGTITVSGIAGITLTSATANPTICLNTQITPITFSTSIGITGATVSSLPAGLSGNFALGIFTISGIPVASGTFPYTITSVGGCTPVSVSGIITVSTSATATISYTGTSFCTADHNFYPVNLNGTGAYAGGTFSAPAGLMLDVHSGAINPGLSAAGNYIITYNGPATGTCGLTVTTAVIVTAAPTVSIAYPAVQYCVTENTLQLAALSGMGFYTGGLFASAAGLSLNPSTGAIDPSLSTPGIYTVTYTTLASSGCIPVIASAPIIINGLPSGVALLTNSVICSRDQTNVNLSANLPGTTFSWTVVQNGVTGATVGTGDTINQVLETATDNPGTAVYTVTLVSAQGCIGSSITVTIQVNPSPEPYLSDGTICINPLTGIVSRAFLLDSGLDDMGFDFVWSLDGVVKSWTGHSHIADEAGTYNVVATNTTTGCKSLPATGNVSETNVAEFVTIEGNEVFSDYPVIIINVPVAGNFVYQVDHGSFQASNVFSGLNYGTHTVSVKDDEGCTDMTQLFSIIGYPRFFTPNGDGFNDFWNIEGLPEGSHATVYIFDRYGKLVSQIAPDNPGWNGTFNGKQLPSTDYWFTVEYYVDRKSNIYQSHFSLKR